MKQLLILVLFCVFTLGEYNLKSKHGHAITSAYNTSVMSYSFEDEVARQEALIDIFWEKELAYLKKYGLADTHKILDLAGGHGYFASKLLEHFPRLRVTVVDNDPKLVALGTERFDKYIKDSRLQIVEADIRNYTVPKETYEGIIIRHSYQYIPTLSDEAEEEQLYLEHHKKALRDNGYIVVIVEDRGHPPVVTPDVSFVDADKAFAQFWQTKIRGPLPHWDFGRELWMGLDDMGFKNISLDSITVHIGPKSPSYQALLKYWSPDRYSKLVPGFLSAGNNTALRKNWDEAVAAGINVVLTEVVGFGERNVTKDKKEGDDEDDEDAPGSASAAGGDDEDASAEGMGKKKKGDDDDDDEESEEKPKAKKGKGKKPKFNLHDEL